jgi:hypothetical protein
MKQKESVLFYHAQAAEQGLTGKDLEAFIATEIFHGIRAGDVECKKTYIKDDEKECMRYAKSLVSNHFKKAPELNGGIKYVPATVRGPIIKDEMLKELNVNLKALKALENADENLIQAVEAAIAQRQAQVDEAKQVSKKEKALPSVDQIKEELAKLGVVV